MTDGPLPGRDPMAGAHWCDQHSRRECTRKSKRSKVRCHNIAIAGRDACLNHVGEGLDLAKAKGEALLTAWRADLGSEPSVDPSWAVMASLHVAVLRAGLLGQLLERQVAVDDIVAAGLDEGDQQTPDDEAVPSSTSGLIGHVYAPAPTAPGGRIPTSEAARGLAVLEAAERDRVVRFAKTAHDMGIADAQIRLAEQQGQLLAAGLSWWLERRGLAGDPAALADMGVMLRALAEGRAPQTIEGETT